MSVYFAKVGEYVKVGWSTDVTRRLYGIKATVASPADLDQSAPVELLHVVDQASWPEESWAHKRLAHVRATGEWFHDGPEVRAFIENRMVEQRLAYAWPYRYGMRRRAPKHLRDAIAEAKRGSAA